MTELVEDPRDEHDRQNDKQQPRRIKGLENAADDAVYEVQPPVGDHYGYKDGDENGRRVEKLEHPGDRVYDARADGLYAQVES